MKIKFWTSLRAPICDRYDKLYVTEIKYPVDRIESKVHNNIHRKHIRESADIVIIQRSAMVI